MSSLVNYNIPCPKCKEIGEYQIFHSVNSDIDNIISKLINNKINFVSCKNCGNFFHVKTGLIFNNINKMYSVYYNPTSFDLNEKECNKIKKMLGENFYLANPSRYKDWDLFIQEIKRKEGISQPVNLGSAKKYVSTGSGSNSSFDNLWSCDICDGNSETGCLYFDPSECPRHT